MSAAGPVVVGMKATSPGGLVPAGAVRALSEPWGCEGWLGCAAM
jgi:hypothetical protein